MTARAEEQTDDPPFARIAIVGFGLIGGSIALAARKRWSRARIVAVDRRDVVATALQARAADDGGEDVRACAGADLIVLAAPVETNIGLLQDVSQHVNGNVQVTDVGSTKRQIAESALRLPSGGLQFIGGHPLSGASTGGLNAARSDLFAGQSWILTPAGGDDLPMDRLSRFVEGLGARVHVMTPEAHDAAMAYVSHLPQLVASALMHVVGERTGENGLALAGRGLRDTTRLASSPLDIWRDIASTNRDNIIPAIDELIDVLVRMKSGSEAIASTFESAAHWKRVLDAGREPA
jgi:prephenate dehydrogenase